MPVDYLEFAQIRETLSSSASIKTEGFKALVNISRLVDEGDSKVEAQELILRALERRKDFNGLSKLLDSLVRQVGLFPYLEPGSLCTSDQLAWEFHRPLNMPEKVVFHGPQERVYRALLNGNSVVLSAPTSFGKSLITDAIIASGKVNNVLVVVPTIALIDETRRRLGKSFHGSFKVITHPSQEPAKKNIFVLTQERVLERGILEMVDLVVIDEFYKLSAEDQRSARLNEVFYKTVKLKKQFYLLGPNVKGLSDGSTKKFDYVEFKEEFKTVVSEIHQIDPGSDPLKTLTNLCKTLDDPTLVFCSSPASATRVVLALIEALELSGEANKEAADWVAATYHPGWHFVTALRNAIGIHHGRVPRSLAHYVVSAFNSDKMKFLVCTSTLIEGVNTKAKNVIIYDDKINKSRIDFFTFNNIKGRSGRMGRHYIGNVYLFHPAPTDPLPFVDIPALSQPDNLDASLLLQLDEEDLNSKSKKRLQGFLNQEFLDIETLRKNSWVDPTLQIDLAKEIRSKIEFYHPLLSWKGIPKYNQIYAVCRLMWNFLGGKKLAPGSRLKANVLGMRIIELHSNPPIKNLIKAQLTRIDDPDEAVQSVLDFIKLWATFHFPQLLRAIDNIQRDVFKRVKRTAGDYTLYANRVEHLFNDSAIVALDEYGIPLEVAKKLRLSLLPYENLDQALMRLKGLNLDSLGLTDFEKSLVREARETL